MWRISKIVFFSALLLILIVSLAGILVAWYYQDRVKEMVVDGINRQVRTEVSVGDISFSLLRKFPQASVVFKDVLIMVPDEFMRSVDATAGSDTLFTAGTVFLQFNLMNLFRQQYRINRFIAEKGVLYLAVNSREEENYRFWKPSESGNGNFSMDLSKVIIEDYRIKYSNDAGKLQIDSDLRRVEMTGSFNSATSEIRGTVIGTTREFRHKGLVYSGIHEISARASIVSDDKSFEIEEGKIDLSGMRLDVSGRYDKGGPGSIRMDLKGYNLDIASAVNLLDDENRKRLSPYKFSGKFNFSAIVGGQIGKSVFPGIRAGISSEKGEIIRTDTGMRLSGISLSGNYSNGIRRNNATSSFVVDRFSSDFGSGNINGSGSIKDFANPVVDLDISATVMLEELAGFYKPENILQMGGKVSTSFTAKGRLQKPDKWDIDEFNKMDIAGTLEIDNGLFEISHSKHIASEVTGVLHFGETLRSEDLSFNIGSDHFLINGTIGNGLPWLLGDDQVMTITGRFFSRKLNLDNYIEPSTANQDRTDNPGRLLFPANLELDLDFLVDELQFRKFFSSGINGQLSYKPRMMVLNGVEFNSMDGRVFGNGVIAQKLNGDFMLQSQLQMQEVNIQKMFLTFNNFGQTFIHGEHLNGSLTGNLGLISEWTPNLVLRRERIIADSKVEISNGELIRFEPMLGLARFINVSELNHVKFSTLKNEIFIRDQLVTIPQMDVNSSAFNISGSGTHHFNGQFDYHLKVLLSDVLYGRARQARPENQKYGIIEDDGLGRTSLYLKVSGTATDYKVSYDHRTVRDVLKENIAGERNILRQILRKEYGWYSSDTSNLATPVSGNGGSGAIRITWDEEQEKVVSPPVISPPPPATAEPGEKKFEIIWDEEEEPPAKRKK